MRYRGLDPRTALLRWGLLAIGIGIVLGATAPSAARLLVDAVVAAPATVSWYLERLTAFLSYLAIAGSVVYGLLLSTKLLDAIAHRPVSFALHQDLAAFGLGLGGIHGALLGLDRTIHFSLADLAIPFASPYRPVWVGVGQLALYATLAVVLSFYARRRLGQRRWRLLHYATFLVFAAATVHGVAAGTDSGTAWAWWIYVGSAATVAFLLAYRVTVSVGSRLGAAAHARRATASGPRRTAALPAVAPARPLRPGSETLSQPASGSRYAPGRS